jgi:hypothetical protein
MVANYLTRFNGKNSSKSQTPKPLLTPEQKWMMPRIIRKLAGWCSQRPIETIMLGLLVLIIASLSLLRHFASEVTFHTPRKVHVVDYNGIEELIDNNVNASIQMRQIIISAPRIGTSQGALCYDIFYELFKLQNLIENLSFGAPKDFIIESEDSSTKKEYLTYKDICYKMNRKLGKECLVLSPLLYWKNDQNVFMKDTNPLRTLSNYPVMKTPFGEAYGDGSQTM